VKLTSDDRQVRAEVQGGLGVLLERQGAHHLPQLPPGTDLMKTRLGRKVFGQSSILELRIKCHLEKNRLNLSDNNDHSSSKFLCPLKLIKNIYKN
jgi:hypothetical protein